MSQNKYQKINFANPNIFESSSAPSTTAPAVDEPSTSTSAAAVKTTTSNSSSNTSIRSTTAENDDRKYEESNSVPAKKQTTTDDSSSGESQQQQTAYKHPLQNTWTLWYLENDRSKSWEDMQNEITSVDTVEDFWSLYNHIKPPSEIKMGSDYSLFKKGIRPMWEDAANKQGGRWVITLNKSSKSDLDNLWLDVLLCLIGEAFDHSDEICGAVVNIRPKSNKISIWTAHGNNEDAALEIGHKLREALRLGRQNLQYQLHKDTMVKQGSSVKSIYTL